MSETSLILAMTPTPATAQCGETLSLQFTATNTTDDLIDVHSLSFKFEPGTYPTSLAHDFKNVTFRARQGGWLMHQEGANFIVTPANKESGQVGPKGLEFDISGIIVNDDPGTTAVTMGKTIGADKTHSEIVAYLSKVYPSLAIHSFHAVKSNILYDTAPELLWEASLGAAITLSSPNGTITHVKGHPDLPLPSSGSYQIDTPLIQNTNFTLTANANALAVTQAEVQSQTMVSIMPPAVQLTSTIPPDAKPLEVELDWQIKGATSATLTSNKSTTSEDIAPQNGTKTQNILSKTTFTLTAQNPVNRTPTSVTTTIAPAPFGWQCIAPDQASSGKKSQIFSSHKGLILFTDQSGMTITMQTSMDGFEWVNSTADFPFKKRNFRPCVAHTDDTTYISFTTIGSENIEQLIYSSTDLQEWSEVVGPDVPFTAAAGASSICIDDAGSLFTLTEGLEMPVKKLLPGASAWQDLAVVRYYGQSGMKWFAGKLWLITCESQDTAPLKIQSSPDGITWTTSEGPTFTQGAISLNFAVFEDHLCLLDVQNSNSGNPDMPVPFAMWRMDAQGSWTQDAQVPNVMLKPSSWGPDVACYDGVVYTAGNGFMTPTGGIWASNAPN